MQDFLILKIVESAAVKAMQQAEDIGEATSALQLWYVGSCMFPTGSLTPIQRIVVSRIPGSASSKSTTWLTPNPNGPWGGQQGNIQTKTQKLGRQAFLSGIVFGTGKPLKVAHWISLLVWGPPNGDNFHFSIRTWSSWSWKSMIQVYII